MKSVAFYLENLMISPILFERKAIEICFMETIPRRCNQIWFQNLAGNVFSGSKYLSIFPISLW